MMLVFFFYLFLHSFNIYFGFILFTVLLFFCKQIFAVLVKKKPKIENSQFNHLHESFVKLELKAQSNGPPEHTIHQFNVVMLPSKR